MTSPNHLQTIHSTFEKWLFLTSFDTIDVIAAAYLANRLEGARVWICLLGASGCGKTTVAESLLGLPNTIAIDAIGAGTFASGYRVKNSNERFGLFERLASGRNHMLIVPDFSTILQEVPQVRNKVLAQLRRIYDGKWDQHHGTGVDVNWTGKVGMIACATPNWEQIVGAETAFGERFVYWKIRTPDPRALGERALRNTDKTDKLREELAAAMGTLNRVKPPGELKIPLSIRNVLAKEVSFVALARTPVARDRISREILDKPHEESPTRLAQQLGQLLKGLMVLYQTTEVTEDLLEIIESCAYSSIPNTRLWTLAAVPNGGAPISEIHRNAKLPRSVTFRTLEELSEIGLLTREGSTRDVKWFPAVEWRPFFKRIRVAVKRAGYREQSEEPE